MIYRQEGYVLRTVGGVHTLLPYGQKIADQQRGITLNETGVLLWEELFTPQTKEALCQALALHYHAEGEAFDRICHDVEQFVDQLVTMGVLREDLHRENAPYYGMMKIAGLYIKMFGEETFFSKEFSPFLTADDAQPDMELEVVNSVPISRRNGRILLRNPEMTICKWENGYVARFHTMKNIEEAYMNETGSYVRFHCVTSDANEQSQENLFHAFRLFFLYLAQKRGYIAVHSASILYGGKAWLFSGPSGMGKSTHTKLWHEVVKTPYLNGDLNLIGKDKDGTVTVYGIPWCGTSGIYTTQSYPLGGIVLLGRSDEDRLNGLTAYEKIIRVMQRMISPAWTGALMDKNLAFAEMLAKKIPIYHLCCTKNPSAVHLLKEEIDAKEAQS